MTPLYSFRCSACHWQAEAMLTIDNRDKKAPKCLKCGKRMKRIPAVAVPRFRGKGWTSPGPLAQKEP